MDRAVEHACQLGRHAPHRDDLMHVVAVVHGKNAEAGAAEKRRLLKYRVEHRCQIAGRTVDHLEDFRCCRLSLQRLPGLVEQPRILDGDDGLVCKALQQRELLLGERHGTVAMHDESADRLALAPQRRAHHRAGARAARVWQAGPVGDCRIEIVQIGNVDLPVLAKHRSGQIAPADPEFGRRKLRADTLRARADADHPGPFVTAGDIKRDARSAEQAGGGLGDLLQRLFGIARCAGDSAQDFSAAGLTIADGAQLGQEPRVLHRGRGLLGDRFVALAQTRLEPLL